MTGYENLGPNVSQSPQAVSPGAGQYSSEDHSFEQVVFQQNRPPLDWEWNLIQSILGNAGLRAALQRTIPSGFLTGDFMSVDLPNGGSDCSYGFVAPDPGVGANANRLKFKSSNLVVNGWAVRLEFTGTSVSGENLVVVPVPPVGGSRHDLVFLEVWRALVSPAPSTDNKSPAGQILRHGNAKAPDVPNVNLADDILDPTYLQETARRVQIQYRLRTFPGANFTSYPDGLGDPALVANTVPYLFASPVDGAPSAYPYIPSSTDAGLWVAGTGDAVAAAALGTVDGYMYAIPICGLFRRNSSPFDRLLNLNGGSPMTSPTSDRPDGLFADQIVAEDVLDMRKTSNLDPSEVFDKGVRSLLKNSLATTFDSSGLGTFGPTLTMVNSAGNGGHMGDPDGVRVTFSDRVTDQAVVVASVQAIPFFSLTFSLTSLDIPWAPGSNVKVKAPVGTVITGVNKVRVVTATNDYDALDPTSPYPVNNISFFAAPGPEIDSFTILFSGFVAPSTVYVELVLEYPKSHGLTRNLVQMTNAWVPSTIPVWADPAQFFATSDPNRLSLGPSHWWSDRLHREASILYPSLPIVSILRTTDSSTTTVMIPDRVDPTTLSIAGKVVSTVTEGTAYTTVTFAPAVAAPGDPVTVTYSALRPAPQLGGAPFDTIDFFYWSRARQTLPVPAGIRTLRIIPKFIGPFHYVTAGSGSPDSVLLGLPENPGVQVALPFVPAINAPESVMDSPQIVSIPYQELDKTGFVELPTTFGYQFNQPTTLYTNGSPTLDGDGRSYWPFSSASGTDSNIAAFSVPASPFVVRKVFFSILAELADDFPEYGRKGSMVLVVVATGKYASSDNFVTMGPPPFSNNGGASVYKLRGNPVNPARTT